MQHPWRRRRTGRTITMEELAQQPFPGPDLILLCSFGAELNTSKSRRQLRSALLSAGYGGPLGRYLLDASPLLYRRSKDRYQLRRYRP